MDDIDLLDPDVLDALAGAENAEVRIGFTMATAEFATAMAARSTAEAMAAIRDVLDDARRHPEVFVDDVWGADTAEFAERAAIADLAVRMSMSERSIREHRHQADVLIHRTPRVWRDFREGEVSVANARTVAELAFSLPDDPGIWAAFDEQVVEPARRLAPARFSTRARTIRDRVHAEPLRERHERACSERRVVVDRDLDGMTWMNLYLSAEVVEHSVAYLDAIVDELASAPDETRTRDQLRADVASDLLTGRHSGGGGSVTTTVNVTVPVLSLLDAGDAPATLEGYGPIDAETARRLAAHAPSFTRLLTHPITGAVLELDRTTYRVPADLKRMLAARDGGCVFPGCGRRARSCDLDHNQDWSCGGTTSAKNLAHLCRHHHRLKHRTKWRIRNDNGRITWTSPTGRVFGADPPPF